MKSVFSVNESRPLSALPAAVVDSASNLGATCVFLGTNDGWKVVAFKLSCFELGLKGWDSRELLLSI